MRMDTFCCDLLATKIIIRAKVSYVPLGVSSKVTRNRLRGNQGGKCEGRSTEFPNSPLPRMQTTGTTSVVYRLTGERHDRFIFAA